VNTTLTSFSAFIG